MIYGNLFLTSWFLTVVGINLKFLVRVVLNAFEEPVSGRIDCNNWLISLLIWSQQNWRLAPLVSCGNSSLEGQCSLVVLKRGEAVYP